MVITITTIITIPVLKKHQEKKFNTLVIAEAAQAHDGSLGLAHSFIDAAADAGADIIKFQTHIASAESTPSEPWRVKFSSQDRSRYDYWKRMEFSKEQWKELKAHCDQRKIEFLSSPFSVEAAELLEQIGIKRWKIASGEASNTPLIEFISETTLPVIISNGLAGDETLKNVMEKMGSRDITIMQCTSMYPSPPESIYLEGVKKIKENFGCKSGLSDHSGTIYPSLAAAALGADAVEVHITFSKKMFGVDVPSSITIEELKNLTDGIKFINSMSSDEIAPDKNIQTIFGRSLVPARDIPKGTKLEKSHFKYKKPGGGLKYEELGNITGKTAARDMKQDEIITDKDFE